MLALIRELYPIGRSITGPGLRATVQCLSKVVPLQITEVPSGTQVFDWTVPDEWSIDEAYIEDPYGSRVVDLRDSSLHVVSYSVPIDTEMTLSELKPHLHSLPTSSGLDSISNDLLHARLGILYCRIAY